MTVLVKIGVPVDDREDWDDSEGDSREHMWFVLKEMSGAKLVAELQNEPYYVSGLHRGDVREYPVSMVTDWVIMLPEQRITPDDVYLLEYIKGAG